MSVISPVTVAVGRRLASERVRSWLAVLALMTLVVSGVTALVTIAPAAAAGSPCGANINAIVCENQQPGTPESVWDVPGAGDATIQGFATDISVNAGNPISFKIDTDASAYTIAVYRLGYYGGDGARRVATVTPSATLPQTQPACASDPSTSLYDCGTWAVSATWAVPSSAVSGVYLADLTRTDTGGMSQITFVVRNDSSTSDIVYQTSDETWQAYNRYGGSDFYTGDQQNLFDSPTRARALSYNRPFITRGDGGGRDFLFSNEYPTIRYLERNGYDVTYIAGVDTDRYGAQLLTKHKIFMSVGHDEYWSLPQRTNVQNALAAGVNMMFLSGNEVFWHTRFASSIDGTNTPYRTLICYKDTWDNKVSDPSGESTGTWRDPRFSAAPGGSSPENALTGTIYMANSDDLPLTVTAAQGKDRLWRNTGLSSMSGASTAVAQHIIGYESDEDLDNGFRNPGQIDLSTTTGSTPEELDDFGQNTAPGTTTHHITLYRAPSGALVFGAGTIQWGWGLDADHDGTAGAASPIMQQMMVNLFADMMVQPQTLMSGLVAATASTDTTPPTSRITSPASGAAVANGTNLSVTGTASDAGGGVVAGVEISLDGGTTWHPASGTTSWAYTGVMHGNGPVSILSRATDDSMNTETPGAGVVVTTSCPCSLLGQSTPMTTDNGDPSRAELGVRFSPDTSGYVTGVRFYKSAKNTGSHIGTLWTAGGTQLATGTFTSETASGWQTLAFASPVAVSAGVTYVAGYWAPNGHYSEDDYDFYYHDLNAPPLHAQANSPTDASKVNGVYATSNSFPNQAYEGANYFVDPVFVAGSNGMPSIVSTNPAAGGSGAPVSTTPSAVFSTAVTPASIVFSVTGPSGQLAGSVAYDAPSRTATFTPSVPLSSGTTYTASISATSTSGTAMASPSTWSFTTAGAVSCPCTLFPTAAVPSGVDSGDSSKLSVGTRFTSSVSGFITGERFYKAAANTGAHTASLWSASGTLLASARYGSESASGWQSVSFSPAVAVTAGTTYVVSYYAPSGHYSEDDQYFATSVVNGPLTGPAGAGVYTYGADNFPQSSYANANYWVDPIFNTSAGTPTNTPPTVDSSTPADGATGIATSASVTATFSASVTPSSLIFTVSTVVGPIAGAVSYSDTSHTATFTPSGGLSTGTRYAVSVSATGTNGVAMTSPATWSFTTVGATTCPCTLLPAGATPGSVDSGDRSSTSLGVQFSASTAGSVTGIRFYKASTNTGTHTGTLWTASGTSLATGTFTSESASGWQTLVFSSPVAITAGTTYVVSYFDPNGHYSEDDHYFDSPVTNGPLSAPVAAGVYSYGGTSTFPTTAYANANYWVDPIFTTSSTPPAAPTVASMTPGSGATGVATTSKAAAVFSIPVAAASITFTVTGPSGAVAGGVSYASGSQTATFTPAAALAASTTYTASVTASSSADGTPMTSPQTWTFTTAAVRDTTPPVITAVSAGGSGTMATITWATDEASTSSVAYGTSAGALTSSVTAAGLTKTHTVTLTGLAANTRYYYRVTSADAAANSATSPAAPAAAASYAPTIAPSTDTTTADFGGGTASSTYVAANGDGEVVLTPKAVAEFTGTTLPSGFTSTVKASGGKTTVANGLATLKGTSVTTNATYGNGVSLEARAALGPNHRLGWVTGSNSAVQMAFSVNSSNQLLATVNDGGSNNASSVVSSSWTPATMHKFGIHWTSSTATFFVDDTQVYTHAFSTRYASTYRPVFADSVASDTGLVLDWMRIGPYSASGTFTSRVFDDLAPVKWGAMTWDASVPTGTTMVVQIRTGSTATPGAAWTAWKTVSSSGTALGVTARYLQYQLALTSTGSRFMTPAVRSVQVAASV